MPILRCVVVRKPVKTHICYWCDSVIRGEHLHLYGMAERGDTPIDARMCRACAIETSDNYANKKIVEAAAKLSPYPSIDYEDSGRKFDPYADVERIEELTGKRFIL